MFVSPIVTGHHSVTQENSITSESLIFNFLPLDYTVAGEATISSSSFLTFLLVLKCSLPTYCSLLGYVSISQTNNCPTSKGNLKPSSWYDDELKWPANTASLTEWVWWEFIWWRHQVSPSGIPDTGKYWSAQYSSALGNEKYTPCYFVSQTLWLTEKLTEILNTVICFLSQLFCHYCW